MPKDDPLRLRMKTFIHPETGEMYLVASGFYDPQSDRMRAYGMRDDRTIQIDCSLDDWNALPYHYFRADGEAAKPTTSLSIEPFHIRL